ncbi:SDR family NAD(P)-dependent oxidoreductase [Glycomyces buryatensis]|uniref:SDR family oxidoreductase n=1 Tax=Glycomyces buryatensis TaxID=2570927 RepID=A0A4S8PZH1_9ACTN|nr:SDR family oxidoreductase [Glycomyces buryatensis]THV37070.1 SDR family oxidoreductase [Glycomyces buryatensis]
MVDNESRTALITGASAGLGEALAEHLAADGWNLILTARGEERLAKTAERLGAEYLAGDLAWDAAHRERLVALAQDRIDLLVNNASTLGQLPLPTLDKADLSVWPDVFELNMRAPIHLAQLALPSLRRRRGAIVNITSDAATGPYPTWGAYGASKAALDQLSNVLAAEEPDVRVWSLDPGEMRTAMLTAAVGEADAAEAGDPADSAAAIVRLVEARPASGRYEAKAFKEGSNPPEGSRE